MSELLMNNKEVKKEIARLRKLEKKEQDKLMLLKDKHKLVDKEFIKIMYTEHQKEIF